MSPLHQAALIARVVREAGHDDDATLIDSIEGETEALPVVDRLIDALSEAEASAAVCKLRADELTRRANLHEARRIRYRNVLLNFMEECGIKTLARPEATLSVRAARPGVTWEADLNVDALPERFVRVTRAPDKTAIKAAILEGESVPGAAKSNGTPSLSIRRA